MCNFQTSQSEEIRAQLTELLTVVTAQQGHYKPRHISASFQTVKCVWGKSLKKTRGGLSDTKQKQKKKFLKRSR